MWIKHKEAMINLANVTSLHKEVICKELYITFNLVSQGDIVRIKYKTKKERDFDFDGILAFLDENNDFNVLELA